MLKKVATRITSYNVCYTKLLRAIDDDVPGVGDTVTFTLRLDNLGPDLASGIEVANSTPASLSERTVASGDSWLSAGVPW